nr:aminotransferase class I/II-fold pyridoxal phosphate-dependent enzyme [Brevibacillus dissolubilis]
MERQRRAPLYDALVQHAKKRPHSFHVPGHKMGASFDRTAKEHFQSLLALDVTELSGMDDLHQPEGIIAEAQALAAEAYGAEETRFLIGGSTVGNIAAIMAVCRPGDKILVQRNCHKSVYNGIIMARAEPVYIVPAVDPKTGVATCVRRDDVERTLQAHPDAKAVFLTNPTYYGMGVDLEKMAVTVHRFGIPLLVDEAHGAHYGFHPALPLSAMQSGADLSVQSTHKMGTSMTMSSMVHVQGERIDRARLYRALAMIQSSSPSYPLMASLDVSRRHMVLEGAKEIDRLLPALSRLRERIRHLPWLYTPTVEDRNRNVYSTLDPLKLLLSLRTKQHTGYQLQSLLESQAIYPELAHPDHILLAASVGTTEDDLDKLAHVLEKIEYHTEQVHTIFQAGILASSFLQESVTPMHEALDAEKKTVSLAEAVGAVCAEMVIPYPPGIPLLVPGERITRETIAVLQELRGSGARFHGVADADLHTIAILR